MAESVYCRIDQLRHAQAKATISLCQQFIKEYPDILTQARPQTGKSSFYPRRSPQDSELDPQRSLIEQFNLLRVVDNERYPAFFELAGHQYVIRVMKALRDV